MFSKGLEKLDKKCYILISRTHIMRAYNPAENGDKK